MTTRGREIRGKLPSSSRPISCSVSLGTLGLVGGAKEGWTDGRSSASRRLANMSWSLERFGPVWKQKEKKIKNRSEKVAEKKDKE